MTTPFAAISTRVPAGPVREKIEVAARLAMRFTDKAATIRKDPTLSPQGQIERIVRSELVAGFAGHYLQLKREVDRAIAAIAAETGGLRKRSTDLLGDGFSAAASPPKTRYYLRSLAPNERRQLAFKDDPLIQAAILEAPAFLSGVDAQIYSAVEQRAVEFGIWRAPWRAGGRSLCMGERRSGA